MNRHRSFTRRTVAILAIALGAITLSRVSSARADDYPYRQRLSRSHSVVDGNVVRVSVLVDGRTTPLFFRPGTWDRHYFEALRGGNYSIALENSSNERIGVVLAVDGLNVVNGVRSRLSNDEPMYVLGPYERTVIRGWRTSLEEVRRFVFVDEDRSYAERTGQANGDLGWIRVLAFREQTPAVWYDPRLRKERAQDRDETGPPMAPAPEGREEAQGGRAKAEGKALNGTPDASGPTAQANPGTGWGDRRNDPVREVEFDAANRPSDRIILRYEYADGLRALGIFPTRWRLWDRERGQLGFAAPPRW